MKTLLRGAVAAALSAVSFSAPSEAQVNPATCAVTEVSFFLAAVDGGNADACAGWYVGNDSNEQVLVQSVMTGWGFGEVTEEFKVEGPAAPGEWSTMEGPFSFGGVYTNFAVAVKAGNYFSLFHYMGSADAFSFDLDFRYGGSHYSLYTDERVSVPEPTTWFLLGSSLLALSGLAWRRREEILA